MEAADQGGDDVAVFGMIIVAAAVQIGRHHIDEVGAVLAAIGLHHLDPGDLGNRIGLVGRLQRPRQHGILAQRLRRQLGVDAGRAEEHQLLGAVDMRRVDHIGRNRQIVVEEFGAQRVVGDDAADLGRRQKHHLRARLAANQSVDRGLIAQIDLAAGRPSAVRRFPAPAGAPARSRPCRDARQRRPSCLSAQTGGLPLATSRRASARSLATISLTSWANDVFGFQPSFSRALLASPTRRSTSVGRK